MVARKHGTYGNHAAGRHPLLADHSAIKIRGERPGSCGPPGKSELLLEERRDGGKEVLQRLRTVVVTGLGVMAQPRGRTIPGSENLV